MAGYADTYLRGLQQLAPMIHSRRMDEEREANNEFNRRLAVENQKRQYQLMQNQELNRSRQLQMEMQQQRGLAQQRDVTNQRATQGLELRMQQLLQAQGIATRAAEQRDKPPLKQGYMRDPQDPSKQTEVPGGPAWRAQSSKHADDLQRLGAFGEVADASKDVVARILDPKVESSGFNPNFGGYNALISQHMPSVVPTFGQTQNIKASLENLKSNLKAQGASLMRGVGGSPGSITEREWPILEKMIENLSPMMEEKEAREALQRISHRFEGMKQRSLSSYKQEWGDSPFFNKDPFKAPAPVDGEVPPGVDPKDWKYMSPQDKALWTTPPQAR